MTEPKKPRKTRKDKGKKRGKRTIKNPRLQTGSLDFRHIGTTATMGTNLTALAGLVASSRPAFPTFSQDQQLINELRKKEEQVKNTELIIKQQNIPPQPAFEPDVEQGQEENYHFRQVKRAMGNRIARLNQEKEDLQTLLETNKTLTEEQINDLQERIAKLQDDIDLSGLGGYFYEENFLFQEQKVKELTRELAQERQQGYAMMDKMVELERERQILTQEQDYLRQETENLTGLTRQQQRELELRNEEIQRAQERIMKQEQTLDEEIKRGLQFKDEELRRAAMESDELRRKNIGLEEKIKQNLVSKEELRFIREQERKASSLIGKQQLEKLKLTQQLEQQRDQFEEERQSLKGKLLEIESQKDLIYETALQAEQEYNEEARTSNEIVGMMAEELLSEKYRKQQEITEMSSFIELLDKPPKILSGEEVRLFEKYGKGTGSYMPTESELLQLVKEHETKQEKEAEIQRELRMRQFESSLYKQENEQLKKELQYMTLSQKSLQPGYEYGGGGGFIPQELSQRSFSQSQESIPELSEGSLYEEEDEDYSRLAGIDLGRGSPYGRGWYDDDRHISDNN